MPIYCGNNYNDKRLKKKGWRIGTNYECLRKGIGVGKNLPPYKEKYNPIDRRKFYCGKKRRAPSGYFAKGSPSKCLQIGIGVGKSQGRSKPRSKPKRKRKSLRFSFTGKSMQVVDYWAVCTVLIVITAIALFCLLYKMRPDIVLKKISDDPVLEGNQPPIDWVKFGLLYFSIMSALAFFCLYCLLRMKDN